MKKILSKKLVCTIAFTLVLTCPKLSWAQLLQVSSVPTSSRTSYSMRDITQIRNYYLNLYQDQLSGLEEDLDNIIFGGNVSFSYYDGDESGDGVTHATVRYYSSLADLASDISHAAFDLTDPGFTYAERSALLDDVNSQLWVLGQALNSEVNGYGLSDELNTIMSDLDGFIASFNWINSDTGENCYAALDNLIAEYSDAGDEPYGFKQDLENIQNRVSSLDSSIRAYRYNRTGSPSTISSQAQSIANSLENIADDMETFLDSLHRLNQLLDEWPILASDYGY